jgi:hypothetical protein
MRLTPQAAGVGIKKPAGKAGQGLYVGHKKARSGGGLLTHVWQFARMVALVRTFVNMYI